jgi:hypothetical protein
MSATVIPLPVGECPVCGYPALRPEGHADWCGRIARRNREDALEALMHDIVHPPLAHPSVVVHLDGKARPATSSPPRVVKAADHAARVGRRVGGFFDDVA